MQSTWQKMTERRKIIYCWNCSHVWKDHVASFDKKKPCPDCGKKARFSLDAMIFAAIFWLHEKGYRTRACCSGHAWDERLDSIYISIDGNQHFTSHPLGFKIILLNRIGEDTTDELEARRVIIERKLRSKPGSERIEEIKKFNAVLCNWASRLRKNHS